MGLENCRVDTRSRWNLVLHLSWLSVLSRTFAFHNGRFLLFSFICLKISPWKELSCVFNIYLLSYGGTPGGSDAYLLRKCGSSGFDPQILREGINSPCLTLHGQYEHAHGYSPCSRAQLVWHESANVATSIASGLSLAVDSCRGFFFVVALYAVKAVWAWVSSIGRITPKGLAKHPNVRSPCKSLLRRILTVDQL